MSLRTRRQRGLTLIELIVVLTILIALGGIAVAVAPDLLGTAHVAEHATNNTTVENAVQINRFTNASIGDRFDSLVDSAAAPALYAGLPGTGVYETYTLTAEDLPALAAIGLQSVFDGIVLTSNDSATFSYSTYVPTTARALADNGLLCALNDTAPADTQAILTRFGVTFDATSRYLVLGVGPGCTLVGANGTMSEAPVHFSDEADGKANVAYARYCVVVELQDAGTANASARFLGVGVLHGDGPARANDAMAEFYGG